MPLIFGVKEWGEAFVVTQIDLGSRLQKLPTDFDMPLKTSDVQRGPTVLFFPPIGVSPISQQ